MQHTISVARATKQEHAEAISCSKFNYISLKQEMHKMSYTGIGFRECIIIDILPRQSLPQNHKIQVF